MQKQIKNYLIFAILIFVLIAPSFALAAWWNPFSWHWNIFNIFKRPQTTIVAPTNQLTADNAKEQDLYYINLLKEFEANPSVESFYNICNKGKSIKTFMEKEVLSEDELSMKKVPLTLYEAVNSCSITEDKNFVFVMANEGALLAKFNDNDSDEVRINKIKFNEEIKKLDDKKIYGYNKRAAESITPFLEIGRAGGTDLNQDYANFIPPFDDMFFPMDEIQALLSNYGDSKK